MNVLAVLGSPSKNGNSSALAKRFLDEAERQGGSIRCYRLNELEYKPCQACYACKTRIDHRNQYSTPMPALTRTRSGQPRSRHPAK